MKSLNAAVGLASTVVVAAAAGPCPAQTAPPPAFRPNAARPTRPPLSGPGSLNGVWVSAKFSDQRAGPPTGLINIPEASEGKPAPLLPEAAKVYQQRVKDAVEGRPFAVTRSRCLPAGMPSSMIPPAQLPIEIIESPALNQVAVLFEEFTNFRIIHMNAAHSADPDPTYLGESVGHWEGADLVVDTTGISTDTTVVDVTPHSEALHVVERLHRTGPDTLEDRMTIDDPRTFTRTWTLVSRYKRAPPGVDVKEYLCLNDRNRPDATGRTGVQRFGPGS